jgi:hypothetical protein
MDTPIAEEVFHLGTHVGRRQAFGLIARRCTVAEIECLIEARENKLYLSLEPTWEAYCEKRLAVSRSTAERMIHLYKEYGPDVARLGSFARIKPSEYRLFAGLVTAEGLTYNGEVIPLDIQSASKLAQAVDAIRVQSGPPVADPVEQAFTRAEKALETTLVLLSHLQCLNLDDEARARLATVLDLGRNKLDTLAKEGQALSPANRPDS